MILVSVCWDITIILDITSLSIFNAFAGKTVIFERFLEAKTRFDILSSFSGTINEIFSFVLETILLRFDNKIKDPRRQIKGQNVVKIIRDYLKISCPMSKAAATLNTFFKKNKINLSVGKNYFPITKNKVSKLNVNFSSSFGRHLEYYTGMVFKIQTKVKSRKIEVNGGRYDNLISDLGSKIKVPAVGGAINLND